MNSLLRRTGLRMISHFFPQSSRPLRAFVFVLCMGLMFLPQAKADLLQLDNVVWPDGFSSETTVSAVSHLNTNATGQPTMDVGEFIGADRFYNAGFTGGNAIAFSIEAGVAWTGHETLGNVTNADVPEPSNDDDPSLNAVDRHQTWVTHAMGGDGATSQQRGIAYGADIRTMGMAHQWTGSAYSLSFSVNGSNFTNSYLTAVNSGAAVVNSSYSLGGNTGGQGGFNIFIDALADVISLQVPLTTFVFSAGNSGPGANTVGSPGNAYNVITVGAASPANTFDEVASFSSRGPQDYHDPVNGTITGVRTAVDILAPGTSLDLAYYGGQTGGNDSSLPYSPDDSAGTESSYTSVNGTSFSAPIVSGAVALMHDAAIGLGLGAEARQPNVVKAILMTGADKTAGWDNGQFVNAQGQIITEQSLDWAAGAGLLNLDRSFDLLTAGTTNLPTAGGEVERRGWDFGVLDEFGTFNDYLITDELLGGSDFTASLSWMRNRGELDGNTLITGDFGQANLQLQIWDADFTTMIASSESQYNVVEHLFFELPHSGSFGMRVHYDSNTFGDAYTVAYGLAWEGILIPEPSSVILLVLAMACALLKRRARPLRD